MPDHSLPTELRVRDAPVPPLAPRSAPPLAPPMGPALVPALAKTPRWLWLLAALLTFAAGLLLARHWLAAVPPPASTAAEAPPVLAVRVVPATIRNLARPVIGDGSIVAWQELVVGTESSGLRIVEVAFEEGDRVRQGQMLLRLDDTVLTAQQGQADAAIAEAEAALRIAEQDMRRAVELSRSQSVARQTLEQRQAATLQAEARLAATRAAREEVAARLAQTRIRAPTDGIVSRRTALLGGVVGAGQEMLRLIRDGRLELNARIAELDLGPLAPDMPVQVTHGDRRIEARIRAVAPTVAAETRLGIVHVALPADTGLRPGMFARAEIMPPAAPALTVPQEAVLTRDNQAAVLVLPPDTDRVARRVIATGQRRDGLVEVTAGLEPGERVVVAGAGFLSDGDRIRLAP